MEEIDIQVLNAIDGFCRRDRIAGIPYFDSVQSLLGAFNSIADSLGGPCLQQSRQVSNKLTKAPFKLQRKRKRYDATALVFLVETSLTDTRAVARQVVVARAKRLGIPLWPSGAHAEAVGQMRVEGLTVAAGAVGQGPDGGRPGRHPWLRGLRDRVCGPRPRGVRDACASGGPARAPCMRYLGRATGGF